jgi:hypothetical protein
MNQKNCIGEEFIFTNAILRLAKRLSRKQTGERMIKPDAPRLYLRL